jgi:hypothetical protein
MRYAGEKIKLLHLIDEWLSQRNDYPIADLTRCLKSERLWEGKTGWRADHANRIDRRDS